MRTISSIGVAVIALTSVQASAAFLGTAQSFGVLAGSTVTNTGLTSVSGNVGVWPGTAITGFPPGVVTNGTFHASDAVAQTAQADALSAFNALASMAPTTVLTGTDLGGLTLTPGVYFFASSAFLTGTLRLDAQGNPNALFVFQMGSTLISASNSSVLTINAADDCNVYWQVGSSATLGTDSAFQGNILANASITMNTRASLIGGRALALNGAVTLDSNIIEAGCLDIPAPGGIAAGFMALAVTGFGGRRRRA
ncbi:MAG: ice-binding family protein [Phycisphaerales bacterium]